MKQFKTILKFELSSYFQNKAFVGFTLALIVIIGVALSIPRITAFFSTPDGSSSSTTQKDATPILLNCTDADFAFFQDALLPLGYQAVQSDMDETAMRRAVENKEYTRGVIITSPTTYTSVVESISMFDSLSTNFQTLMVTYNQTEQLRALGLDATQSATLLHPTITEHLINTGKNQVDTFLYTYILIFTLYMAILLYGQFVTTSVASEKSSRAMELLITSAKPSSLMFGKVIGSGLAGMCQLTAVFGSAFFFFQINQDLWQDNHIVNSIFNIPGILLIYMLVFFVLGFFIYAFLFGAIGSMASKLEDVNTLTMPIVLVFVACFLIVMSAMNTGDVDSPVMVISSFFPLTSSMAMFTRIAMGNVAFWEILVSMGILLVSTLGLGYLAAKIYRVGVLMYGNKPSFKLIINSLRK